MLLNAMASRCFIVIEPRRPAAEPGEGRLPQRDGAAGRGGEHHHHRRPRGPRRLHGIGRVQRDRRAADAAGVPETVAASVYPAFKPERRAVRERAGRGAPVAVAHCSAARRRWTSASPPATWSRRPPARRCSTTRPCPSTAAWCMRRARARTTCCSAKRWPSPSVARRRRSIYFDRRYHEIAAAAALTSARVRRGVMPLKKDALHVLDGLLEERLIVQRVPRQRLHLHAEVRVVLRHRPQREDQVMRIDGRQLARFDPRADHLRLFVHQRTQFAVEFVAQQRRALDHFQAEEP